MNKEEFLKNANSFSTKVKNDRAFKTWQAYEIDGTPANAVNGKYITAPHMVGTREGAIQVMNYLIEKNEPPRNKRLRFKGGSPPFSFSAASWSRGIRRPR